MENNLKKRNKNKFNKMVKIGNAAVKLFNEKGYLETNMEEISSAAKMSKGGIYHYFYSKSEILFFILNNFMDLLLEGLEEKLKGIEGGLQKIKFLIYRHIEFHTKHPSVSKTLLQQGHLLRSKYKTIAEKEKKYYQIVTSVLSDFEGGHIEKEKLTVITFTLFGMCNWIYSWYNPKGPVTPEELSEIIFQIFTKGISKGRILKSRKSKRRKSFSNFQ
jgi:AcrR family transcriptional regulator